MASEGQSDSVPCVQLVDGARVLARGAADGELPELVACTDSLVFVATSRGYLRSWSVSGVQRSVLNPCGHIVTMVGAGERLAVVFEDSYPLEGGGGDGA